MPETLMAATVYDKPLIYCGRDLWVHANDGGTEALPENRGNDDLWCPDRRLYVVKQCLYFTVSAWCYGRTLGGIFQCLNNVLNAGMLTLLGNQIRSVCVSQIQIR